MSFIGEEGDATISSEDILEFGDMDPAERRYLTKLAKPAADKPPKAPRAPNGSPATVAGGARRKGAKTSGVPKAKAKAKSP